MGYVTPEQITQAKELDLLTYLQRFDPHALVHVGGNTYCTREHDSLKISNGKWNWFSRGIGGKTALDYLIKVQGFSFTQAVETLVGRAAVLPPVSHAAPKPAPSRKLLIPELNSNNDVVLNYLMGRGIHPVVLDFCLEHKLLFETKQYHNALFAGYDQEGKVRYAALRGTLGDFKGEVTGSDKHYSFSISASQESGRLHLFESAIDLLSYATLMLGRGWDWQKDNMLSLAGVYQTKRENVVPIALSRYLQEHPNIHTLQLHLDNDEVGRGAAAGIMGGLQDRYTVLDQPPTNGKDVNELLQRKLGLIQRKEEQSR
jgi:hypothetical protein